MPRPQLHPIDTILDAARDLLLAEGSGSATMEAISKASGAPTGSIYHRFASRDELITQLWIRAVHRSQASWLCALERQDPKEAAVAGAMAFIDFCEDHPADARLLVSFRREDLIRITPRGALTKELEALNRPIGRAAASLARRLYGKTSQAAVERTLLAVLDIPYGAVRRHLIQGAKLPAGLRDDVARAVAAVVDQPLPRSRRSA
jgi:AcrR family transcriptional regulator